MRILTKNAAVVEDFDLIKKHRDRVLVGLSLTATPDRESVISVVEPHASPISERMKALKKAAKLGLRTYGMLCPLLPGIADAPDQIDELVRVRRRLRCRRGLQRGRQRPWQQPDADRAGASGERVCRRGRGNFGDPQTEGMVVLRRQPAREPPAGDAEAHDDREAALPAVPSRA